MAVLVSGEDVRIFKSPVWRELGVVSTETTPGMSGRDSVCIVEMTMPKRLEIRGFHISLLLEDCKYYHISRILHARYSGAQIRS